MLLLSAEVVDNPDWDRWSWGDMRSPEPPGRFVRLTVGSAVITEIPIETGFRVDEEDVARVLADFFGGEK